jgi:hypothetical protein
MEAAMRAARAIVIAAVALGAAAASAPAFADHWHGHGHSRVHFGLYFGGPLYWQPYYPYYPPTVVVPQSPPVYVERGDQAAQAPESQSWWYFCRGSNTYYPYVKQCPGGWERVSPQPPAQ